MKLENKILGIEIRPPKLRNFFTVVFYESGSNFTKVLPELLPISHQAIEIKPADINLKTLIFEFNDEKNLELIIEDDRTNEAVKAIIENKELVFDLAIELLDGDNNVLEQIRYMNCEFTKLSHQDSLDYALRSSLQNNISANFKVKSIMGNAVNDAPGGPELMSALQAFFDTLEINIDKGEYVPRTVQRVLSIIFESQSIVFN